MSKRSLEDKLDELRSLATRPVSDQTTQALRKALSDRVGLVVGQAAKVARDLQLQLLIPDLIQAFDRLIEGGAKADPQCKGKLAIVKALRDLDHRESLPFLKGMRHVQMEPVWGGQQDTASGLRAACALSLVACDDLRRADIFRHLVRALTDEADPVRADAARAIEQMQGDEAGLLLRLKARAGDASPRVTGQVLECLLSLEGDAAIDFVAEFIEVEADDLCEEAALALGASRLPRAITVLKDAWAKWRLQPRGEVLLRMISASSHPEAIEFLLTLVKEGSERESTAAAKAFEVHQNAPEIQARLQEALRSRDS